MRDTALSQSRRNGYMLQGPLARKGYDWWWHSFLAEDTVTGELKPFFIEYFVINPARGNPGGPVFGQLPGKPGLPSYALLKVGTWGGDKCQIHNFYPISDFEASRERQDLRIGPCLASETRLQGSVSLSEADAAAHPEYMSDAGSLSWDLQVRKELSYSVGYGASAPFRSLGAFDMFWHVQGMKTAYEGSLVFNGKTYTVRPETSAGYQDKNWGRDFTSPWIWLNCNRFFDEDGKPQPSASLDVGGGRPVAFGLGLGEKILVAFHYQGRLYEFNFSKIFFQRQSWRCEEKPDCICWQVDVSNFRHRLVLDFSCPREGMLWVNYENPLGIKAHKRLWNGGFAAGTLKLYVKGQDKPLVQLRGEYGGCEYGHSD